MGNTLSLKEERYDTSQTDDKANEIKESCVDKLDRYMVDIKETCEDKASKIVNNDDELVKQICETKSIPMTVTTIQTKLRHSSPLLFSPEEEETQLHSTCLLSDSEYDSGAFSASSTPQFDKRQTLPNSPLLSPQLVLSIIRNEKEEDNFQQEEDIDQSEKYPQQSTTLDGVSITIGHTTQLYVVDRAVTSRRD